jgi:hypothetical protein
MGKQIFNVEITNIPTHKSFIDLTGRKFNRLFVEGFIGRHSIRGGKRRTYWRCICDCGNVIKADSSSIKNGQTKSCGCYNLERTGNINRSHSLTKTPEYMAWINIKTRCHNIKNKNYPRYGGRGITVCDRWKDSFENFFVDMGKRPSTKHSIERRDNSKGYSPDNCSWETQKIQNNNKRNVRKITFNGQSLTASGWAEVFGISRKNILNRISIGWCVYCAFTVTVKNRGSNPHVCTH